MSRQLPKPKTDEEARDRLNEFHKSYHAIMPRDNFLEQFNTVMRCTSATLETDSSPATATFEFNIPVTYRNNPFDTTSHGGAVASLFDNTTSLPLFLVRKDWEGTTGVTRNLNVTYFRPAMGGEDVVVETEVLQCGRTNATMRGVMRRKKDGLVLAHCLHEKVRTGRAKIFKL